MITDKQAVGLRAVIQVKKYDGEFFLGAIPVETQEFQVDLDPDGNIIPGSEILMRREEDGTN